MSAKKSSQNAKAAPSSLAPAAAAAGNAGAPQTDAGHEVAWIESEDPRRRRIGQVALVVIWVYVAALWLLAVDQWFNWGIFGPKIPPLP